MNKKITAIILLIAFIMPALIPAFGDAFSGEKHFCKCGDTAGFACYCCQKEAKKNENADSPCFKRGCKPSGDEKSPQLSQSDPALTAFIYSVKAYQKADQFSGDARLSSPIRCFLIEKPPA
jgi:hypothetical protein